MASSRLIGFVLPLLPLAFAQAETIHVSGRLLDARRGSGLSGATVELFPAWEEYEVATRRLKEKAAPAPLATTRTNDQGVFDIAAPARGLFRLVARAEGFLPMEYLLAPLLEDVELEPATMMRASPLEVRTVGREVQPLAGVEVRISSLDVWATAGLEAPWRLADRRGVSGVDGRVVLPRRELEVPMLVATSAPFLGQVWTGQEGRVATFRLIPQAVQIEVREPEGRLVPDALARWEGKPLASSGIEGRLELALPAADSFLTLESRDGRWARLGRTEGSGTGVIAVQLEPTRRIAGKVIDAATQRPIAGAWVWSGWPLTAPGAQTNAEGSFQLEVSPWVEVRLDAAAAGYLPGEPQPVKSEPAGQVALTLRPAATLAGVVVDGAGQPIAGASATTVFFRKGAQRTVAARSRADGRFQLTGLLPAGAYELTVQRQGFARASVSARTAPPGQASTLVRIVMTDGQTTSGRVVDESGNPVTGAEVTLASSAGRFISSGENWETFTAESDAEGRFTFHHLSPGMVHVSARHPGYSNGQLSGVKLPPGQPRLDLGDVTLPAGAAIEGRVVDTRGGPVANAKVWIGWHVETSRLDVSRRVVHLQEVAAGPDGRFRIADLPRDQRFDVGATHPDFIEARVSAVAAPTQEPIRIEMKAAHGLHGQVVGPTGEPVAGASLLRALGFDVLFSPDPVDPLRPLGMTDSDGRFAVTGLAPGPFNLQVQADGFQPRRVEGLEIPDDRDLADLKVVLEPGAWLAVRVLRSDGEPVSGVQVTASPDEKTMQRDPDPFAFTILPSQTDAEGRCSLSLPGPGLYTVAVVSMRGGPSRQVEAGLGATEVELRFPPGTEVSGRALEEDGSIVPGATLKLSSSGNRAYHALADADGTFTFSGVANGRYDLTALDGDRAGRSSRPLEVEVTGQPVRNLEVRLGPEKPAAILTGRLLGLTPGDLGQVVVLAHDEHYLSRIGEVDQEGAYRIEGLAPGEWSVEAHVFPSGREARGTVEIDAAASGASLDLEFSASFLLTGRVFLDGSPLPGALVVAQSRPEGSYSQVARTTPDGAFTLGNVPAGTLLVGVVGPDKVGDARKIQVSANQEISIAISTGRLSGRVFTASGDPVEDAPIVILGGSAEALAAVEGEQTGSTVPGLRSGSDGSFVLPRITAGTYTLTVEKEGFAPTQVTVEVPPGGERAVEIRLQSQ
jgi:large repetitive protein